MSPSDTCVVQALQGSGLFCYLLQELKAAAPALNPKQLLYTSGYLICTWAYHIQCGAVQALQGSGLFCYLLQELKAGAPALGPKQLPFLHAAAQYAANFEVYEAEEDGSEASAGDAEQVGSTA